MPDTAPKLTRNPKALCEIIDKHVTREQSRLTFRMTMWNLALAYLNGARRFDVFNPSTNSIRPHYLDEEGNMEFQCQEMLSALDRVSGQIASMDVRAKIMRTGSSLQSVRDRAIAQVIADSITPEEQLSRAHTQFSHIFAALGSCGCTGHIEDHPAIGLSGDVEIVHPRELFPFPSLGNDYTKQRGMVRQQTVPLSYLSERFGRKIASNKDSLYWWEAPVGEPDEDGGFSNSTGGYSSFGGGGSNNRNDNPKLTEVGIARVRELWTWGHRNILERYVLCSGEYVIEDLDLRGLETYCPIGFARFLETGTFHGAGVFDLLFGINRQLEMLLKSLFNNIRDTDRYGVVVMPQGQYNERSLLEDVGEGLRVLNWQPDVVDNGFKPFSITPFNTGDVPGKTAAFAKELMQAINPWQDLLREKGRIDSAAGLGFLDEKNRQLMSNPTRAVEQAWSDCHRGLLQGATSALTATRRALPVKHLTIDLAGAVMDAETGEVSFEQNPLPNLSHLSISIREVNPKSEITRKQEAMELMNNELLADPDRFILFSLQEGLDFAMWIEEERAAYETIVRNILLLYANGEDPGEMMMTPHTAMPELQLRVLTAFMSSPTMTMASPRVQDEFLDLREFLLNAQGLTLPSAVPNPDDEALFLSEREQMLKEQASMMAGGGQQPAMQGA